MAIFPANSDEKKVVELLTQLDAHRVATDWNAGGHRIPEPFVLVGYTGPHVVNDHGAAPLLIDAEGVVLASGVVYAWCYGGCCAQPRRWESVDAAADFHGSYIVTGSAAVREPR